MLLFLRFDRLFCKKNQKSCNFARMPSKITIYHVIRKKH